MTKQWELTPEVFDELLAWLDADRDQAGIKYEHIRQSLIKIFIWRGCGEAEDLADITINRVAQKIPELTRTYVGDPARFFYGVAKNVVLEYRKRETLQSSLPVLPVGDNPELEDRTLEVERRHECMERCLRKLSNDNRDLITRYYQRERQAKVDSRKELARQLGMSVLTLRVRTHRLRAFLYECIQQCLSMEPR